MIAWFSLIKRTLGIAALTLATLAKPAGAQSPPPQPRDASAAAAAQKLFEEARSLMAEGRNAEACPKLAASQRLDPGAGTLLNLAECYEKIDRLASAWATYREAETTAQRAGQRERATHCAARAQALSSRLSYLTIVVTATKPSSGAPAADVTVHRNGDPVPEVTWGTALPVDGGTHTIEASARDRESWKSSVQVRSSGDHAKVVIPELKKIESGATPGPRGSSSLIGQRTIGWAAIGVGTAAAGVGLVFGAIAKSRLDEANEHCTQIDCDDTGAKLDRDAKSASTVSTILVLAGAGVVIGGVVLLITAPRDRPTSGVAAASRAALLRGSLLVW